MSAASISATISASLNHLLRNFTQRVLAERRDVADKCTWICIDSVRALSWNCRMANVHAPAVKVRVLSSGRTFLLAVQDANPSWQP